MSEWLPIITAPQDGTEILVICCGAIEIVSWGERQSWYGFFDRQGRMMIPSRWQPLPEHPQLPEVDHG